MWKRGYGPLLMPNTLGRPKGVIGMPWPVTVVLTLGAIALLAKTVIDRKARYDEPANRLDDRFDHMMQPNSERDRELRERRR